MKKDEKAYYLNEIEANPTKDKLSAHFIGNISAKRGGYKFRVDNETNGHIYFVKIFQNSLRDWLIMCDCQAQICKHLNCTKELFEQIREVIEKV